MSGVTGSVLWLALFVAILVGIGAPLVRISVQTGISSKDYIMINYVIGIILTALMLGGRGQPLFSSIAHTPKGAAIAVVATLILNLSFITTVKGLHLPQGYVSVFYMITSSSVIISSIIGLLFLGESGKINLLSWFIGTAMILSGAFLIINSLKH